MSNDNSREGNKKKKTSNESEGTKHFPKKTPQARTQMGRVAEKEQETLEFWRENNIFRKSVEQNDPKNSFVLYDGPPFATGLPHYGHILQGTIKDVIPRYHTMKGKRVRRVWGWDCHGLPVENLIEKEEGLNSKAEIEEYGIGKFNEKAKASVLRYDEQWKKVVPLFGRWIDMEDPYKTMDPKYTESVWWAFSELYKKDLIYKGYKSMHICPRCETTLANSEVTMNYADVKDISVTVKFELVDKYGPNPDGPDPDRNRHGRSRNGQAKTYVLAWTTTPWTLPGNVALAVGEDIEYVKAKRALPVGDTKREPGEPPKELQYSDEFYIVAKELASEVLGDHKVFSTFKGSDLVGKSYVPLFDYYSKDETLENYENGWKVYAGDFVEAEEGTGIVHMAPAFGEDDLLLSQEKDFPFVQHVKMDGTFKPEVTDFAGMKVKRKDDTQSADIEIIKKLAHNGTLFSKKKIEHSYPLCWRCDTPLLNYATSSWFVRVSDLKKKLLSENEGIGWVPESTGKNRFGNWLEGARDWAISRSRYWGAPLPVWECNKCETREVMGGIENIQKKLPESGNTYILMRHGEAENNTKGVTAGSLENDGDGLTEKGEKQAQERGEELKGKNIDLIIASPFLRTKSTAEYVAEAIGYEKNDIVFDERVTEIHTGEFDGKPIEDYHQSFMSTEERFTKRPEGGESWNDVRMRTGTLLEELEKKYKGKNILIVTHQSVAWTFEANAFGFDMKEAVEMRTRALKNAEARTLSYKPFPHNEHHELDLHRPYIDEITFTCACGGKMKRISEVFDCWFESGSMPYAQFHYPFENKELFERNFPADFIAEGLDQTRGWFYTMLILSVGLFDKTAYKNVIVSGMVLAEDGQKMSKKLKNYPDPLMMVETYGADAIRYAMMSSPVVRGTELLFSEKGVDEVVKKIVRRLGNVLSFYELYSSDAESGYKTEESENVLDVWILSRLGELIEGAGNSLENYELDRATRPFGDFIDDLSTWYLRRSRDRFKVQSSEESANPAESESDQEDKSRYDSEVRRDKQYALATLRFVLLELSKTLAPFMPFMTEDMYRRVGGEKESVHLESWPLDFARGKPEAQKADSKILGEMETVREIVSRALELRTREGLKVRQPLAKLTIKSDTLEGKEGLLELIKDEVNVKAVSFDNNLNDEATLDTEITPELREEGEVRELVRHLQNLRKNAGLALGDKAVLEVNTSGGGLVFFETHEPELKKSAQIGEVYHKDAGKGLYEFVLGEKIFCFKLRKAK